MKSAPPDFNVACSSRRMRGNSWVGTWNSTALANTPSMWPQLQRQEVLLEHFTATVRSGQLSQLRRPLEAGRPVPERREGIEVTPRTATEIQQFEGRLRLDGMQQRIGVLAHVVIACAFPVGPGMLVVVRQRACGNSLKVVGGQKHSRSFHAVGIAVDAQYPGASVLPCRSPARGRAASLMRERRQDHRR